MSDVAQAVAATSAAWFAAGAAAFFVIRWNLMRSHAERSDLLDRLQEMVGTIHTYQVAANAQPPPPTQGRSHYTEEQEDVLAQRERLSAEELATALAEAEFMGTEVELEQGPVA